MYNKKKKYKKKHKYNMLKTKKYILSINFPVVKILNIHHGSRNTWANNVHR